VLERSEETRETRDGAVYKQRSASTVLSELKICKNIVKRTDFYFFQYSKNRKAGNISLSLEV
jgi:hypothetical protein